MSSASAIIPGFSVDDTETDLVYGVGVEGKFSGNMSARIEYLTFGDLDVDVVRVGLNYRLGNSRSSRSQGLLVSHARKAV